MSVVHGSGFKCSDGHCYCDSIFVAQLWRDAKHALYMSIRQELSLVSAVHCCTMESGVRQGLLWEKLFLMKWIAARRMEIASSLTEEGSDVGKRMRLIQEMKDLRDFMSVEDLEEMETTMKLLGFCGEDFFNDWTMYIAVRKSKRDSLSEDEKIKPEVGVVSF